MKRILILLVILGMCISLSACGDKAVTDSKGEVTVFNWGLYIDSNLIEKFEEETGYKVNYREFATNEEMYPKVVNEAENYDVLIPSDYMIERLIQEDMLMEINMENVPNFKNIDDAILDLDFDKDNTYSVPYFWGTVGILYNKSMVDETPKSWDIMFDKKYENKILMYDSERDSFMVALIRNGYSMNTDSKEEIEQAKQMLIEQKPLVLGYVVDECQDKMVSGEAALALSWSGEAMAALKENKDLDYIIPKEGSNIWVDSMVIPKTSKNKEGAEAFINFMCRDDVCKQNMEATGYTSANKNVKEMIDEDWASRVAAYPSKESLDKCELFKFSQENLEYISKAWLEVTQH